MQSLKDYYKRINKHTKLNHKEIQISGKVNINATDIYELQTMQVIREKAEEKIIVQWEELGQYNSLKDIIPVSGISATIEKIFLHRFESIIGI